VFWSFAYLALRRVFQLLVLLPRGDRSKEIEILVLLQEVSVLGRQVTRPRPHTRRSCRTRRALIRRRDWDTSFVTPATLLRWHRVSATN
jgi:hypothetical protein